MDFTAVAIQLAAATKKLRSAPEATRHHIERARDAARESLEEARRAVLDLRKPDDGGWVTALDRVAADLSTDETPIRIEVRGPFRPIPRTHELAMVRVAQEGITNAVKHARAKAVNLTVEISARAISLDIRDDGRGLAAAERTPDADDAPGSGMGLLGIRERVEGLGGRLTITSRPGGGTELSVTIPLPP